MRTEKELGTDVYIEALAAQLVGVARHFATERDLYGINQLAAMLTDTLARTVIGASAPGPETEASMMRVIEALAERMNHFRSEVSAFAKSQAPSKGTSH